MITMKEVVDFVKDEIEFHRERLRELAQDGGRDAWGIEMHQQRLDDLSEFEGRLQE